MERVFVLALRAFSQVTHSLLFPFQTVPPPSLFYSLYLLSSTRGPSSSALNLDSGMAWCCFPWTDTFLVSLSFGPLGFPDTRESPVVFSSTLFFLDTLSMGKSTHSYSLTMTSADNPNSSSPGTVYWHRCVCVWGGLYNKYHGESWGTLKSSTTDSSKILHLLESQIFVWPTYPTWTKADPGFIGSQTHIILGRGSSLIKKSKDLT